MSEFDRRLERHQEELRALFFSLYPDREDAYEALLKTLAFYAAARSQSLRQLDTKREADPGWYKRREMLGMCLYIGPWAKNLKGVREKLDYLSQCGVNYVHLMPFLDTPKGKSDGGYAVSDFTKVEPSLGDMDDLETLTREMRKRGMSVCMDFVMNHTSEEHEWARRARAGEAEYQDRYFFYPDRTIPDQFEQTIPEVFPTTAPGSFTWLPDAGKWVMTNFYPFQWDLNYGNPAVLTDMVGFMLALTNRGIDVVRIDAIPYIWKEMGTSCRNLPQVHTISRMLRIIVEAVCPGVLLLGEVVMAPEKIVPYFGSVERPECHMLYNATTMCTTWHTIATADTRLLRHQMDTLSCLPKEYLFLNYIRCHDDIGWGLDYPWLSQFGTSEVPHKRYLSDYLTGHWHGSDSKGELYNDDPVSGDARMCGTTASLCGIETARRECRLDDLQAYIRRDLMLHAFMLTQSGLPILYAGDEIAQENDYTYHLDPDKAADSRFIHRGDFDWEKAEQRLIPGTVEQQIFDGLLRLEAARRSSPAFDSDADFWTLDTGDDGVLGIGRWKDGACVLALFNFAGSGKTARIRETGWWKDLITGEERETDAVQLPPYGYAMLELVHP